MKRKFLLFNKKEKDEEILMAAPLNPKDRLIKIERGLNDLNKVPVSSLCERLKKVQQELAPLVAETGRSGRSLSPPEIHIITLNKYLSFLIKNSERGDLAIVGSDTIAFLIGQVRRALDAIEATPSAVREPIKPESHRPYFSIIEHQELQEGKVESTLPHLSSKEIVLAGQVLSDGLGDFYNMISIIRTLSEKYPGQRVRLILRIDPFHFSKYGELFVVPPNVSLDILLVEAPLYDREGRDVERLISEDGVKLTLPESLQKKVEESCYQLEYYTAEYHPHILKRPDFVFGEAGTEKAGLAEGDMGLFTSTLDSAKSRPLSSLQNDWLRDELAKHYNPSSSRLSLLYMNEKMDYLLPDAISVVALESTTSPSSQEGDVVIITRSFALDGTHSGGFMKSLQKRGFGKIVMKKSDGFEESQTIGRGSRVLYLLNPFPLSHEDFLTLLANNSSPIVGCSGDQSFMEVVAFNHLIPFYQIRNHKTAFWNEYIHYAQAHLGPSHPYVEYLKIIKDLRRIFLYEEALTPLRERIGTLLASPDFYAGARAVHERMIEEKSLPKTLLQFLEAKLI